MSSDARLRAILSRVNSDSPGERLAALAALERLLPAGSTLHGILQVGLFYTGRGTVDASLAEEADRLRGALLEADRRDDRRRRRIAELETALRDALDALRAEDG